MTFRGLIPIMRVRYSLWDQTMTFILVTFTWLFLCCVVAVPVLYLLDHYFPARSAYPNTLHGRLSMALHSLI